MLCYLCTRRNKGVVVVASGPCITVYPNLTEAFKIHMHALTGYPTTTDCFASNRTVQANGKEENKTGKNKAKSLLFSGVEGEYIEY